MTVDSAAVGERAVAGRRMARPMRELMQTLGPEAEAYAEAHRSKLLADVEKPDLIVAVSHIHERRLEILAPGAARVLCSPVIPDPAFGGTEAYAIAWADIRENAEKFADWLREGRE